MQSVLKNFCAFIKVSTNKNIERTIRIVENAVDSIDARHKFLNKLVRATAKGIPIIMILENGFRIDIMTFNDDSYKYPEIEQFMMDTDFINKITSTEFIEVKYQYTKEIMDKYIKIPYQPILKDINYSVQTESKILPLNNYENKNNLQQEVKLNSVTIEKKNEPVYIGYGRGYSPDKRQRPFTPLIPTMQQPRAFVQNQGLMTTPPPGMRYYSKSTSPTSSLNINAQEFFPIHNK